MRIANELHTEAFPVLDDEEAPLVADLGVGLDDPTARVLAYLVARRDSDAGAAEFASKLDVRVGVGLGRSKTDGALSELEGRGLVASAPTAEQTPGRPATEWRATDDAAGTAARVRETHAAALLGQAREFVEAFDVRDSRASSPLDSAVVVGLNWEPNGFHAPLFAAADSFADRGFDVSFGACRGSWAALERLQAGEADVVVAGGATVLRAQADGMAVVPLALLYQRAATALYTTRDAFGTDFESVEQVRGRRIATPAGSETAALCRLLLSQAGVVEDATVVESDGEERRDLLDGDADLVTGMATDVLDLRRQGYAVDSVLLSAHFPAYGPALVVRESTLRGDADRLSAFLEATMAGWRATERDPADAAATLSARSERTPEAERRRLEMALDRFAASEATRKHGWGWHSVDGWRRLRTALEQADVLGDGA